MMMEKKKRTRIKMREPARSTISAEPLLRCYPSPPPRSDIEVLPSHPFAVERVWHTQGSQGQVLVLAFRGNFSNHSSCPLCARKRPARGRNVILASLAEFSRSDTRGQA